MTFTNLTLIRLCSDVQIEFDVISKSQILDSSKPEAQRFLHCLTQIMTERGLDEQDYKCVQCGRPIGLIYGKSRVCKLDGSNYCLDCHQDDKAIVPSRILHNWDFSRYSVSKANKRQLELTEHEPLLDLKTADPLLYELIPQVKECLQLRTQLFYLHAYLFTCQEQVALELRRMVWPNDHLFEHIHLYSTADLFQVSASQ
jgi:hypothetical protein